jgi:hypothetical protein
MIDIIHSVNQHIVNPLIVLMIGWATITFLIGIAVLVFNAGNEEARSKGKRVIVWGLLGLFIMVGVFGIIQIILGTFGIDTPTDVIP